MRRLLPVGGLLAILLAAPALAAGPSPTPEPEDPIRIGISTLLPRALQANGVVQVAGVLRNTGSVPITRLRVRLQVGERISSRSELQAADDDRPPTSLRVSGEPLADTVAPGQTVPFTVLTTVRQLGLSQLGVYPLDIVARGDAGNGSESLGLTPTWLPYFDGFTPRPTRVAVVWPLVDRPYLRPDGTLTAADAAALTRSLRPNGRLGLLLENARVAQAPACEPPIVGADGMPGVRPTRCDPVLVTFAVDPELLEAVQLLATDKSPAAGTAATWLTTLKGLGLGGRLLALPYADPDVSALSRSTRTRGDVATAAALATEVVDNVLGVLPESSLAWPPPGPVAASAADALALAGARAFVLDPEAFDDDGRVRRLTPSTHAAFTTSATGLDLAAMVIEPELSLLLTQTSPYGNRIAEQRFLAETAIIAAEIPGVSRTLVLAPERRASLPAVAREELRDLGRVPWLCPVALADVARRAETCARESSPPGEPTELGSLRTDTADELDQRFLRGVAADRDAGAQLTDAVLSPAPAVRAQVATLKGQVRRAVARAESSIGREDEIAARESAKALHEQVSALSGQVLVRGGRALLTSTKGSLSVSVENTLDLPVQVRVRFTSRTATLTNAETDLVTVQPGHAVQASVHASAQRSGQFVVFAQLVDRNGIPFGPETEIIVRSTKFGRLALAVTLAALGILVVAAGLRIVRRVRAAHGARTTA